MAGLRKANAYSKKKVTPFTRISKRRQKSFIKVIPPQKIVKFEMGKTREFKKGKFPFTMTVVSTEKVQLRHNAMEACRQYINKKLEAELNGNYSFKIIPFPHHIQRENRMLTGAGADRMQTGMQLSFGKSMGKSAILKPESKMFVIGLPTKKSVVFTRKIVNQTRSKLPGKIRINITEKNN
ncbi:MAG: 50S ribosomal protein L16 [Nanoarchaeota archaeon]|nr:50S ribosomal protein L16 [Nanoarchaeota archaeon]